jgi:hypothetical protein
MKRVGISLLALFILLPLAAQETPIPPQNLAAARKAFETRVLNTLAPLDDLRAKFADALMRLKQTAQQKNDAELAKGVDSALISLGQGNAVTPTKLPDLERLRSILDQQTALRSKEALVPLASELQRYRTELEGLKTRLGLTDRSAEVPDLNLEIEQITKDALLVNGGAIPWRSSQHWSELLEGLAWRGRKPVDRKDGRVVLTSEEKESGPRLSSVESFRPPFEVEIRLIPDKTNVRFYYGKGSLIFNWEVDPQQFRIGDFITNRATGVKGKSLLPGVEQTVGIKVLEKSLEVTVDGQPFHSQNHDFSSLDSPIGIGPALGSTLQLISVKTRRPGQLLRAPATTATAPPTLAGSATAGGPPTAESTWPRTLALDDAPEVTAITEDAEKKIFVYRSPHYEFVSDSKLGTNVVREFGRIFESTYLVNCKLPLDLKPKPERLKEFFTATLFTNEKDYLDAGGVEGSAGIYHGGKKTIMVPLASLGVKMFGSRVTIDYQDREFSTLIHEITHQMMNHWLGKMPTWLTEGSAEYVSYAKYDNGKFNFSQIGRDMKGTTTLLKPAELMAISGKEWSDAVKNSDAHMNYRSAALLTYFFYQLDDQKDGAHMIAFFREIEQGVNTADAVAKHLLRGRTHEQLEKDMTTSYRREGVQVTFVSKGGTGTGTTSQ